METATYTKPNKELSWNPIVNAYRLLTERYD